LGLKKKWTISLKGGSEETWGKHKEAEELNMIAIVGAKAGKNNGGGKVNDRGGGGRG